MIYHNPFGAASVDTGSQILQESKAAFTKMSVMVIGVIALFVFLRMR